jgi:Uma2 family endonuclease
MPQPAHRTTLTVDAYLAGEDGADQRHEYVAGQLYAMTGASARHALIAGNLFAALRPCVRGTSCQLFINDMKVHLRIDGQDLFYYPDLLLSCDPQDRETYFRSRPCLLVEVLSESTERIDRREKFWAYRSLPSLQEYVLISQTERRVEIYRRSADWGCETVTAGDLRLGRLPAEISLETLYEDVL